MGGQPYEHREKDRYCCRTERRGEINLRPRIFAFETTLSGLTYATMIPAWRSAGYRVKLLFLSLASEEEAIARVAMRVRQGGHNIPPEVIHRRFVSGAKNFHDVYRPRVDFWQWFDNSGPVPQLRDEGENP